MIMLMRVIANRTRYEIGIGVDCFGMDLLFDSGGKQGKEREAQTPTESIRWLFTAVDEGLEPVGEALREGRSVLQV